MQYIPNILSLIRIVISLIIIFIKSLNIYFITLYSIGGLTDILDGYIARKFKVQSSFGANVDSLADFLFTLISFYKLIFEFKVLNLNYLLFLLILFIKVINYFSVRIKFKEFLSLHTLLNKITGLLLFITPYFLNFKIYSYVNFVYFIALLAALEETIIIFKFKDFQPNVKTIFYLKNKGS